LKLKYDEPLSNFAFNVNVRHYNQTTEQTTKPTTKQPTEQTTEPTTDRAADGAADRAAEQAAEQTTDQPPAAASGAWTPSQRNLWVGAGVTSRLHFDAHDNLHGVLHGRKVFLLFPPHTSRVEPAEHAEGGRAWRILLATSSSTFETLVS
jgi:hypothetical protein